MKKDTKFVFNRKRPNVIRYVKQLLPDGRFVGELMRTGDVDLVTRPENWVDVCGQVKVSFTGTRDGMSYEQITSLDRVLSEFLPSLFVHGDCIGADYNAHKLVLEINASFDHQIAINTYPANLEKMRAHTGEQYEVREPLPPLERNSLIVNAGQLLLACPGETLERLRSGTWATVRAARRANRWVIMIDPDGGIFNIGPSIFNIGHMFE